MDDHLRTSEIIRTLALDGILNQIRRAELYGYLDHGSFSAYAETFSDGENWAEVSEQEVRESAIIAVRDGNKPRAASPERVKN